MSSMAFHFLPYISLRGTSSFVLGYICHPIGAYHKKPGKAGRGDVILSFTDQATNIRGG